MEQSSYFIACPICKRLVDKRDLEQVLSHGFYNAKTRKYECLDEAIEVTGVTAVKIKGDNRDHEVQQ